MEQKDNIFSIIEIDLKKVGWSSIIMTIVLSFVGMLIYTLLYNVFGFNFTLLDFLFFLIGYTVLIFLHECFHLIGFWLFGKVPWSSMNYGVNLKMGIAYATTSIPLPNHAMKKALLLPFWMTGVSPMIIGYLIGSPLLVILGAWLIGGAAGDFAMYKELRKYPSDVYIKDDPEKPKLYVLKKS